MSNIKSRTKTKIAQTVTPKKNSKKYGGMSREEFAKWVESTDDVEYMLIMNQIYLETRGRPMYPKHELKVIEEIARKRRVDSGHQ